MKDFVSTHRGGVLGLVALLSLACVAAGFLLPGVPSGFRWLALASLGSALSVALIGAEHVRNYTACLNRRGYCDRSQLTPSEVASIPPEVQ